MPASEPVRSSYAPHTRSAGRTRAVSPAPVWPALACYAQALAGQPLLATAMAPATATEPASPAPTVPRLTLPDTESSAAPIGATAAALWLPPALFGHASDAASPPVPSTTTVTVTDSCAWAATAHAAAHLRHGQAPQPTQGLKPLQCTLLGLLEDARVEHAMLRELPGLRALWVAQHTVTHHNSHNGFDALLARLSLALLDPTYTDPHPWIVKVRAAVMAPDGHTWRMDSFAALRPLASVLGNEIGQMRLPFDARTYTGPAPYRDDNTHLWLPQDVHATDTPDVPDAPPEEPPEPPPTQALSPPPARPQPQAIPYPEWDARIGRMRPDWAHVVVGPRPVPALAAPGLQPFASGGRHSAAVRRLARSLMAQQQGVHTPAGVAAEGQHLHPMAALDAHMDRLRGLTPDWRVFRGERRVAQPLAVWLLLDASLSMNGQGADLHRLGVQAASALALLGHRTALWSLASDGRHHVGMQCLKQWDEALADDTAAAALACSGSSRLGAGLRHGLAEHARDARTHPGWRRMVIVVTDGELHDIDVHDPAYLYGDLAHCRAEAAQLHVSLRGLLHATDRAERFRAVMGAENCAVATSDRTLLAVLKGLLAS